MKKTNIDLIPTHVNPSPDYYCTWQTQLYATSDGKPPAQRAVLGEHALFAEEKPFGWAYFYEKARNDLFFVMDDSWDVSPAGEKDAFGSLILDAEKFPEATTGAQTNGEALLRLSERIRALGWKGLGGWVCAQKASRFADIPDEDYWKQRLLEADASGFSYWKVDWGKRGTDAAFRRMLTELGRQYAPNLVMEHAMVKEVLPDVDVFRTYDVPALMSIPMTLSKLCAFADITRGDGNTMSLLNCEDEVYIAAAGGFSMGVMRHPYAGAFLNGRADMSFPAVHRNIKTKMYEVLRAVRWHRIAPAFPFDGASLCIDKRLLRDTFRFEKREEELEAWWADAPILRDAWTADGISVSAPARIARGCALPSIVPNEEGDMPYVIASRNPNGAYAVATLGRTKARRYAIPKCDISLAIENADTIGVFGQYKKLTLETDGTNVTSVLMQDLAGDFAYDVTAHVRMEEKRVEIPGEWIERIGTVTQPRGDTSEPGVLIRLIKKR